MREAAAGPGVRTLETLCQKCVLVLALLLSGYAFLGRSLTSLKLHQKVSQHSSYHLLGLLRSDPGVFTVGGLLSLLG